MLRGGVIGFGRMGLTHFSILNAHPKVELVAVCDSSSFILKIAAKYMGVQTFKEPEKMIERVPLDFLIIATPTAHHADMVRLAIDKGLHVFVEKPFVLRVEQGQEILSLLQGKTLVNQVGYVLRFSDIFRQVKYKCLNTPLCAGHRIVTDFGDSRDIMHLNMSEPYPGIPAHTMTSSEDRMPLPNSP